MSSRLKPGVAFILAFVGVKMLLTHTPFKVPTIFSPGVIGGVLTLSVISSIQFRQKTKPN